MLQLQTSIKFIMYTVLIYDNVMLNNHYVKNSSYIICKMEIKYHVYVIMCSINMINRFSNFQQGQEIFLFSIASTLALGPTEPPI